MPSAANDDQRFSRSFACNSWKGVMLTRGRMCCVERSDFSGGRRLVRFPKR